MTATLLARRLLAELTGDAAADLSAAGGPETLAAALREHGLGARALRPAARDWRHLSTPCLVLNGADEARILRRVRRGTAELEDGDGTRTRVAVTTLAAQGMTVIEASRPLPPGANLPVRLLRALVGERRLGLQLAGLCLLVQAGSVAVPLVTGGLIDRLMPGAQPDALVLVVAGLAVIQLHLLALDACREWVARLLGAKLEARVLGASFSHILAKPLAALLGRDLGGLLQPLASADTLNRTVLQTASGFVLDAAMLAAALAGLAATPSGLALPLAGFGILLLSACALLATRHAALQRAEIAAAEEQTGALYELTAAAPTLVACGAGPKGFAAWIRRLVDQETAVLRRQRCALWLDLLLDGGYGAARAAVLVWAAARCLDGAMSLGGLFAAVMMADRVMKAVLGFAHGLLAVSGAAVHLGRVEEIFGDAPRPTPRRPLPRRSGGPAIEAAGLWFRYGPDLPWILTGRDLRVEWGSVVQLDGRSGSGKTTLLRILAGLQQPERGEVSVCGLDPEAARQAVYYLPQNTRLFEGTIRSNLELLSGVPLSEAMAAARRTGLFALIERLPMGLDTPLPPGGGNLSGGQRQLIALTAAFASSRPILLLDEALANIDRATQAELWKTDLLRGRTVVMVNHDAVLPPDSTGSCNKVEQGNAAR
ncbi:ATP-binding cassette domain-containing protein [Azospirillum sp. sgz301742]